MDYEFAYRLSAAPTAINDGSGMVQHDIWAVYRESGSGDPWSGAAVVPGRHKTISLPADELQAVLDMPHGGAKVTAYKQCLADNLNTQPVPITGWTGVQLEAAMDANDCAASAAENANTYITVDLGLDYPVNFTI